MFVQTSRLILTQMYLRTTDPVVGDYFPPKYQRLLTICHVLLTDWQTQETAQNSRFMLQK